MTLYLCSSLPYLDLFAISLWLKFSTRLQGILMHTDILMDMDILMEMDIHIIMDMNMSILMKKEI